MEVRKVAEEWKIWDEEEEVAKSEEEVRKLVPEKFHVIRPEGIKIEEEKVKRVLDWLTPKCVKNVQKFLGLANYYHQFIKDFASIARPLYDMVKKNQKWDWTEKQEKTFGELKDRFTKEPLLAVPDLDKK